MELFKLLGTIVIDGIESASKGLENISEQAKKVGEKISDAGDKIEGVGKKFMPATAAIGGVAVAAGKMSIDFEDAMAKVSTIADESQMSLEDMEAAILELSNETGIAATDIADNVYNAISAGQSTGDAVNFVSEATKLARAGFADSASSLDILTTAMNAYGMEADRVTDVSDMLIMTQNLGKTTVGELSSAMGKVIPTANANNVEMEQLCASYAILTSNGIATAESTTYLNSMLNELGKGGTGVDKILREKTGKSFSELSAEGYSLADVLDIVSIAADEQGKSFTDVWSSAEASKAALVLLGDSADGFNSTLTKMQGASGATDVAFQKLDTTSYNIEKSLNQLKNTGIELGNSIMTAAAPLIDQLAAGVQKLSEWFSSLDESQKQTIIQIAAVVAAIGPALIIVGKIISGIGTMISVFNKVKTAITVVKGAMVAFNAVMMANPVVLIVAAIVALIAIFVVLWNKCEGFRNFWIGLWEGIKSVVSTALTTVKETFSNIWNSMVNVVTTVFETIKNVLTVAGMFIVELFKAWFNLITLPYRFIWENCKDTIMEIWEAIKTAVQTAVNAIKTVITTVFNAIKNFITPYWEAIKTFISTIWDGIKTKISTAINAIKDTITNIFDTVKTTVTNVWTSITTSISTAITNVKTTISNGLKTALSTVTNILGNIKNKFTSIFDSVKNVVHNAIEAIKSKFNFSWSLPKLKMPHFKISGSFSLNPPSVPSFGVDWYAKAMNNPMIMNSPTAFGINNLGQVMAGGEAGSEVVSGTNTLMGMIGQAVAANMGAEQIAEAVKSAVMEGLESIDFSANIKLEPDDRRLFKVVEKQAKIQKKSTGRQVFV